MGSKFGVRRGVLVAIVFVFSVVLGAPAPSHGSTELTDKQLLSTPGGGRALLPRIARSGDVAYAMHFKEGAFGGFKVDRLGDGGTLRERTTSVPCPGNCSGNFDIAADERYAFVLFERYDPDGGVSNTEVHVAASDDRGTTFTEPKIISGSPGVTSWFSQLAVSGDSAYAAWEEQGKVMVRRLTMDRVVHAHQAVEIGRTRSQGSSEIAAVGGSVFVAWADTTGVWLRISRDAARTFGPPVQLSTATHAYGVSVAASAGKGFVSWAEYPGNERDPAKAQLATVDAGGAVSVAPVAELASALASAPTLAAGGGRAYFAYAGRTGIYFARSGEAGRMIAAARAYTAPELSVNGGNVDVVWSARPVPTEVRVEVQVASSHDGGASFSVQGGDSFGFPGDVITTAPALTAFDDGFSLAWMAVDNGNYNTGRFTVGHRGGKQGDPDLGLTHIEPVQAAQGVEDLVAGKPLAVRASVRSGLKRSAVGIEVEVQQGGRSERHTVSVPLKYGLQDVWLPVPAFRPEPGDEDVRTRVRVDPGNTVDEPDEANNEITLEQDVVDTRSLELLYVPVAVMAGAPAPSCTTVGKLAAGARAFMVGAFPVDERETPRGYACGAPLLAHPEIGTEAMLAELLRELASRRWDAPSVDKVVGVVPDGFFKAHYPPAPNAIGISPLQQRDEIPAVLIEAGAAPGASPSLQGGHTLAHELAHNLGVEHLDAAAPGYWVQRSRAFTTERDFMAPAAGDRWIAADTFERLMRRLEPAPAQRLAAAGGLAVSGRLDGAALDTGAWFAVDREPDVQPGSTGQITAEYLDAGGALVTTAGFDVEHPIEAAGTQAEPVTGTSFSVVLPAVADARTVRLRRGTTLLASRTLSAGAPTVTVTGPTATALVGDPLTVTWDSGDADGDALRHNVALSRDGGDTWMSVATDVRGESFTFTPSAQDTTTRALVRVTVSDGLRTASDVGDAPFAIRPGSGALALARGGRIALMNDDGSGVTPVTNPPAGARDSAPDWSPDGRRIAFARSGHGLYVVGADGSGERLVHEGDAADPSWTPDGQALLFTESGSVQRVPVAGGEASFITLGEHPDVSPDGTTIAFNRDGALWVAAADGSGARELVRRALEPDWAPDGKRILVSGCEVDYALGLCLVDPADGATTRIPAPPAAGAPTFASDGTRVAYAHTWSAVETNTVFGEETMIAPLSASSALTLISSGSRVYRSELGGAPPAWTQPVEVERSNYSHGVGLAVNARGEALGAWGNLSGSCYRLAAAERAANGTWSAPAALSEPCEWARWPSVGLADDGTAHVAWYDQQRSPYTARVRSRVNGVWGPTVVLSEGSVSSDGVDLVTAPGGRTVAVWVEDNGRLVARLREPGASAWGAPQVLSAPDRYFANDVELRADAAGRFTVSWLDYAGLQVRALDAAGTWGPERTLVGGFPARAHLAVGPDGTAAVVYRTGDVASLHIRRDGVWGPRLELTRSADFIAPPGIDADGTIVTVYSDDRPSGLYSRRITAAGMQPAEVVAGADHTTPMRTGTDVVGPRFTADGAVWTLWKRNGAFPSALRWTPSRIGAVGVDGSGAETFGAVGDPADTDPDFQHAPATAPEDPEPAGPVADTGGPYTGAEGADIALAAGAGGADYAWDLDGDGAYDDATGREATARFGDEGTFTIGLRVTDAAGAVATAATTVTVTDVPLTLGSVRAQQREDGTAVLDAVLIDPGSDDRHEATVDWGDGPVPATLVTGEGGRHVQATHVYTTPGTHRVTVRVRDLAGGGTVEATADVEVLEADRAPTAADAAASTAHAVPVRIPLTGGDPDGDPVSAELVGGPAFGTAAVVDGEPLTGEAGTVVYTPQPGFAGTDTFTWRARAGALRSQTVTVTVSVAAAVAEQPVPTPVADPGTVFDAPPVAIPPTVVFEPQPEPPTAAAVAAALERALDADPALAEQVIRAPSSRTCVSRRKLTLRFFGKRGVKLRQATVRIATRKPLVLRGRALKPTVDLRGLPKGTFKVRVTAITTSGRTLTINRTYRTCVPRKGGRK